ncbi:TATA-binding protein-associated phosphoprotein [Entamoeba marina]
MQKNSGVKEEQQQFSKDRYFETRNYLASQQAVFFALLNKSTSFVVSKPTKRSIITDQLFKVKTIILSNGNEIDVIEFVDSRCKEKMVLDLKNGINEYTALRRFNSNKIIENHHFLIDLAREEGFVFKSTFSSGKNNTTKMETISHIFYNNYYLLDKKEIIGIGKEISECISKKISSTSDGVIQKSDSDLQRIISKIVDSKIQNTKPIKN